MRLNNWLRKEVSRLEQEIRNHSVFNTVSPASPDELRDLKTKVAVHTYLRQQMLRRVGSPRDYDTREQELILSGYAAV